MEDLQLLEPLSFSDTESIDTDYDIEDRTPIERYGYVMVNNRAGGIVYTDAYSTPSVLDDIPINDYKESVVFAIEQRISTFRNLVIQIQGGSYFRKISLSNKSLMKHGNGNLINGFNTAIQSILHNEIKELYEDYDQAIERYEQAYDMDMNGFQITTSYFCVVYDQPNSLDGGLVKEVTRTSFLEVENVFPSYYGVYNCFFDCITQSINKKIDVDIARKIMKAKSGNISLRNIRRFEVKYRIAITVYVDSLTDKECPLACYTPTIESAIHVKLVLFNNHYYVYKGPKTSNCLDIKDVYEGIGCYLFYDFETYVDSKTLRIIPYAMSYTIIEGGKTVKSCCIYKSSIDDDIEPQIVSLFNKMDENTSTMIIGFNNGAFDDYILIDILSSSTKNLSRTMVDKGSRILSFQYGRMRSKDAYRFFITSLKKATESFQCKSLKGNLDHDEIQMYVESGRYNEWIKDNEDRLVDYSIADVESLAELYFKTRDIFNDINPYLDLDNSITLSQMSMTAFKKGLSDEKCTLPILDNSCDDIIRKALVGGRCQIFNPCIETSHEVQCIDVVSLYPYVMINRKYPIITEDYDKDIEYFVSTTTFDETHFGVYNVLITRQPRDCIVPMRTESGLNWEPTQEFNTWSDSITLKCLRRHGGSFEVFEGYVVKLPQRDIFSSYLSPIMEEKTQQDRWKGNQDVRYNPAMRECLKLLMNALSGKMGQRPINHDKQLCNATKSFDYLINKYPRESTSVIPIRNKLYLIEAEIPDEKVSITSPTMLAVMIYAYAREYMYDNFISKVEYKYGMDTDSLFLRSTELDKISTSLFGNDCGQVKSELPSGCHGIYVAKKMYANYISKGDSYNIIRLKFKGVSKNDKLIPDGYVDKVKSLIKDSKWRDISSLWEQFQNAYSINALKDVLMNKQIHVLCIQIRRTLHGNSKIESFTIRRQYIVKKFPHDFNPEDAL